MILRRRLLLLLICLGSCKPSISYVDRKKTSQGDGAENNNNDDDLSGNGTSGSTKPVIPGSGTKNGKGPEITPTTKVIRAKQPTAVPRIDVATDNPNVTYQWSTKSGPAVLIFQPSNTLNPVVSAPADGNYVAVLEVRDGTGASATQEFEFTWDTSAPEITMPADMRITGPEKITGASVTDLDKNVTLEWKLVSSKSSLSFDDSKILQPVVTPAEIGMYIVELTARDSLGNSRSGYMNIERFTALDPVGPVLKLGRNIITNTLRSPEGVEASSNNGPMSYLWQTTSGPSDLTFEKSTDLLPQISAKQDGAYVATLAVKDKSSVTAIRSLIFVWDTIAPDVNLTSPLLATQPTSPTITATDANRRMTYFWEQQSGPGTLFFSHRENLSPAISASKDGSYTAQITVTDAAGNKTTKQLAFEWKTPDSLAPVIEIGNPLEIFAPTKLSAVTVKDNDPNLSFKWDQIFGPGKISFETDSILNPVITPSNFGDYLVRLTAKDSTGNKSESYLRIRWSSGDATPPVISLPQTLSASEPTAPTPVSIVDLTALSLKWTQVSGPGSLLFSDATIATPLISATLPGSYVARLTATDVAGNSSFKDLPITWIKIDRTSPVVRIGQEVRSATAFTPTDVSVTDDDNVLSYSWSQVTGPGVLTFTKNTDLKPLISASAPGTYVASLQVKDRQGNTGSGMLVITWFIPDQSAPVISMGPNLKLNQPTALSQVKATDNDPQLTFLWKKLSGPGTVTFSPINQPSPVVSMDLDGTYVLQLAVNDSAGNKSVGEITVLWDRTPPKVFAGTDRTVKGSFVIQDATAVDVSPMSLSWKVMSQPLNSKLNILDVGQLNPKIEADYPGLYQLELTATDSNGLSASSRVSVTFDIGQWVPTSGGVCATVCRSVSKVNGRSPEGAQCASGENAIASSFAWIKFIHGCWPNCNKVYSRDASSINQYCYHSTQKRDNDWTDVTVGCFCN